MAAIARHLQRWFHANDRNVVFVAQLVGCGGSGGIASDDNRFHSLLHETFHNGVGQLAYLFRCFGSVRSVRGIAKIQHAFVRHIAADFARHGNPAQTGIENADWCR